MNRGLEIAADAADSANAAGPGPGLGRRRGADGRALPPAQRRDGERRSEDARQGSPAPRRRRPPTCSSTATDRRGRVAEPRRRHRRRRRRRPGRAARSRRPPRPPARTGPRGRRDRRHRAARRPRGGFTAVLAMANTTPVTDTAEAAKQVYDLGRATRLVDVQPVGAVTKASPARSSPSWASWRARGPGSGSSPTTATASRTRGSCAAPWSTSGVRRRHHPARPGPATSPVPTPAPRERALGPARPARLARIAEESIVARDVMLARHTGSRVHIAHVSTAGSVEVIRWAKAQGIDVTAEVTPHHLLLTTRPALVYDPVWKVNPPLRPEEDVRALREGARRRHHRRGRHRPRAARAARQGARLRRRCARDARPRDGAGRWSARSWSAPACSTGPASPGSCPTTPPGSPGWTDHGQPLAAGSPANLTLVDPSAPGRPSTATPRLAVAQQPLARAQLTGAVVATVLRGRATALDGGLA